MMFSCFPPCEDGNRLVMKLDIVDECCFALGGERAPFRSANESVELTQMCRATSEENQSL